MAKVDGDKGTYGQSRGGKGVQKTVVSKSDNDSGAEPGVVAAAGALYRAAVNNSKGNAGASDPALKTR